MRSRIFARTLMSSIETGSSATSRSGPTMIERAIAARCFWPPERSAGRLEAKRSTGARPTSSSVSRTFASVSASPLVSLWIFNGCASAVASVIPGFSDACGSWKTICRYRRFGRSWRSVRPTSSSPRSFTLPAGRPHQPEQRPAERRLAGARLADQPEHLALAEVERHAVDGLHRAAAATGQPRAERPVQREVDLEVADLDQVLGGDRRHASSATASTSRSIGASIPAGMSSLWCSQHSDRRAGPVATVGGHVCAQIFIASGQRGGTGTPAAG